MLHSWLNIESSDKIFDRCTRNISEKGNSYLMVVQHCVTNGKTSRFKDWQFLKSILAFLVRLHSIGVLWGIGLRDDAILDKIFDGHAWNISEKCNPSLIVIQNCVTNGKTSRFKEWQFLKYILVALVRLA